VEDVLQKAQSLIAGYDEELVRELPEGAEVFDAHVHLGHDIDGMTGVYEDLERTNFHYGISRCFMFCMDEIDRHPAFRAANDRTLAYAERSDGRFIPFVRLDLSEEPIEEATRCLDLGARGIKLHPRAQRFLLNDERLAPVFALAAERNVPILIHGGRGLPPIADGLRRLVDSNPGAQLIIAHAGIADLGALAAEFGGMAGVYFDTSVWSPIDLLSLYHLVSPEQVVYASDYPYGQQPSSLLIALRTAHLAGFGDKEMRAMLAGTANRIAGARRSRSRWRSRASTSTCRWRPRCCGRARPTRSACSASRSTRPPTGTATRRNASGSASCSRRPATSGARSRRSRTRASSESSAARRFGSSTWRTSWR
jgi:predicted TIM-barrel fold metal-dependent hydrolase